MSEAWRALPEQLPLRYFDPWYVRFVLSARIEQHIIEQCRGHDPAPVGSGRLSETLAELNTCGRNGLLKGLGDILPPAILSHAWVAMNSSSSRTMSRVRKPR